MRLDRVLSIVATRLERVWSEYHSDEKKILVVITSGMRDEVRQGLLFSSDYVYRKYPLGHWHFICHAQFSVNSSA